MILVKARSHVHSYQAPVIIWDLNTCEVLHRLELHKGHVQDVAFSPDEKYVATLGGVDDNNLVIWNMVRRMALWASDVGRQAWCGTTGSTDTFSLQSASLQAVREHAYS